MYRSVAFFPALFFCLVGCQRQVQIDDGFGLLAFGSSSVQVSKLGFFCGKQSADCKNAKGQKYHVFEMSGEPSLTLENDRLTQVDVLIEEYSEDEVIDAYTKFFGEPRKCRFTNALGAVIEKSEWQNENGSTAVVSKIIDYGITPNLANSSGPGSIVVYSDPVKSREFRKVSC